MAGVSFATFISIGLPLIVLVYALSRRRLSAFLFGILAFVGSQVLLRIPLLEYVSTHSTGFVMLSATQPFLFAIVLGLSAGIFEELARYLVMRFLMKRRDWQAGFLFGAGHGGIEAVLFVGIPVITLLLTPSSLTDNATYLVGGVERFFAMMLHIGLSIIVLQGVVRKKFSYVLVAIAIHGFVDSLVGIIPLYVPKAYILPVLEVTVAVIAFAVFYYSLLLKRKGELQ